MASSWRYGKRSKYRIKASQDPEDYFCLDPKKSAAENAHDIYTALCCRDTRDTKRLFLLNGLATLCQQCYQKLQQQQQQQLLPKQHKNHQQQQQQQNQESKINLGFTTEELLYCLSASLVHTFTQVRAAALRTIRYVLATPKDIRIFNSIQLQHLLCRSIDVLLKNDDERVQALKLIRKMLAISPGDISPVIVRCLVSLAESGIDDGDNMLRACLATLCEFAVLNPMLLIVCGGVTSITRNVLECHNPRIAESLCGVLLYLLEWPQTRNISGVRLDCLAAPYCDFTYRLGIMDKNKDARELRYTSCRLALLSVLRSWIGTIEFCDPSKPSGLKAIVDALYLNQTEVRKAILDLLYELLSLPQPAWTDDYVVALQTVDPSDFQDAWLLSNGFVAMEGRSILPSLAARAPNVCEQHLSLLLYCFLETGLLNALVEVIVSSDAHLSVRATILIGKILNLMHTHLPADICSTSSALPTLLSHATQGNQNANAAITALQNYQKMLRNRPASCSIFLDNIIQGGPLIQTRLFRRDINIQDQVHANSQLSPAATTGLVVGGTMERTRVDSVSSSDESMSQSSSSRRSSFRFKRKLLPFLEKVRIIHLIKDSYVLQHADSNSWDWEVITTILRIQLIRKIDETTGKFLKRLVHFFKPSSNRFSHEDLANGHATPAYVTAGLDLIDWLLACTELESVRLLTDLFTDIGEHLLAVTTSSRVHDCLFSPQHMNNTMCQQYFHYIGRMCRMQKGIDVLNNAAIFEHSITLIQTGDHVCYVKLIISGLDYSVEPAPRKVLEKALTSAKTRSGRLYATQFLTVLLRARIPNFEVWGIPLILKQTKDRDRGVVLAAFDVLEEACHEKYYLEEIISLWHNLKPVGDVGRLLMARYYSLPRGLNHRKARTQEEIFYWKYGYNKRYVLIVEADTHASLTLHVRNEDGYYSRRNCNTRPIIIPPNIPPHLYGQLVQTEKGTTALREHGDLSQLVEIISRGKSSDDAECLELKAAIWAVGHASTHSNGIEYFTESGSRIYEKLVMLATKCEVYSIRATCFSVLGLIGGTNAGANILFKLNWLSVRHDRKTSWPVHQPEDWMSSNYTPVRHHCENVPPYNYTGIEDQIDGSYYTGSYEFLLLGTNSANRDGGGAPSASSEMQEPTVSTEGGKPGDEVNKPIITASAKSRTLPEGAYPRYGKHQRSLSESKTTDVISLIGGPGTYHQHRVRYNSCTDSNTSGVSSCDSVTVRGAAVSDYQQFPLSPIPSMSNLADATPQSSLLRRTSLLGTSYLQNVISPADIKGYIRLRSLRRYCRPVLSESAADLYDIIDRGELMSFASFRPRKSSFGESQRHLKARSLDRQLSLKMYSQEPQMPMPNYSEPKFLFQEDLKGPCYAGICLPKNLLDLFPKRNVTRTYVSRDIQDQDLMDLNLLTAKDQFLNDSLNNEGGDESSVISSLSDVSSVSKRSKWIGAKHGRSNCLHCSRVRRNRMHGQRLDSETTPCDIYTNTTAALVAAGLQATVALARKSNKHQSHQQANVQSSSTIQLSDISFNSPESILSEESMPDRLTASILYNVQRLANPVSAKQSKMALLELKQKHPASFQDICLYSEVCKTLGRSTYRMNSRRFLQELFLDLNFDLFYTEPLEILNKKEKDFGHNDKSDNSTMDRRLSDLATGDTNASLSPVSNPDIASSSAKSSSGASSSGGSATTVCTGFAQTHKPHLKSQPLASVYETSWENLLLDSSPRHLGSMETARKGNEYNTKPPLPVSSLKSQEKAIKNSNNTLKMSSSSSSSTIAPPPAAPPPQQRNELQTELRITSDDEDNDSVSITAGTSRLDVDEVDGPFQRMLNKRSSSSTISSDPAPAYSISTLKSSSNCSDQTSNSNRSSICTISHQPLSTTTSSVSVTPLENENKKYTRGRFYTLELDLSCTKNKFKITDRTRNHRTETTVTTSGEAASAATNPVSPTDAAPNLQRHSSLGANSSSDYKLPIMRPFYPTTTTTTARSNTANVGDLSPTASSTYTITKSLAASLGKPIGSLYCEKRLQTANSEAVLTNVPTTTASSTNKATHALPSATTTQAAGASQSVKAVGGAQVVSATAVSTSKQP